MELTNEQFRQLTGLEAPAEAPGMDRRNSARVIFGKRAKIRPLFGDAPDGGKTALLRDVSVAGVGLLLADPMEDGDEFILRAPIDGGGHLYIHCMVRHCEAGGTGGAQFVVGASFELVLDPATLSDEQTADHHERIEVVRSAARVADEGTHEQEAVSHRGLFSALHSLREARRAAKLRKRLRSNTTVVTNDAGEMNREAAPAPALQHETPAATVTGSGVAKRERKSLFAVAQPATTPAPVVEKTLIESPLMEAALVEAPVALEPTAAPAIVDPRAADSEPSERAQIDVNSYELVLPAAFGVTTTVVESFAAAMPLPNLAAPAQAADERSQTIEVSVAGVRARPINQEQLLNRSAARSRHPRSCRRHLAYR